MFFFFFLIIKLYFLIAPVIAKTLKPTAKHLTSMRMSTKEAKTGMEILPVIVGAN